MNTQHAEIRAQQRGIPPLMDELLDRYGHEQHDGHGAVILFLDKQSIRSMERDLGRRPVARLAEWLDVYKVRTSDGQTITIGHRTRRIWRK
ncbi:MAG: hypothetical protein EBY18_23405 [Alphaproteobacteria bacterium]|jgi:hypothetical protein|nr:hypothetical protein [Alphaproteobacteria bacterium]